jgi:hypothetical protein
LSCLQGSISLPRKIGIEAVFPPKALGLLSADYKNVRSIIKEGEELLEDNLLSRLLNEAENVSKNEAVIVTIKTIISIIKETFLRESSNLSQDDNDKIYRLRTIIDNKLSRESRSRLQNYIEKQIQDESGFLLRRIIRAILPSDSPRLSAEEHEHVRWFLENFQQYLQDVGQSVSALIRTYSDVEEAAGQMRQAVREISTALSEYAESPLTLLRNCISSLSKMPPETGLLMGRLLYFIFGTSRGDKVDIQQLSLSYEGSYARIRTECEANNESAALGCIKHDYLLLLATKSDFCLVHAHIPFTSDEMWALDSEVLNWIRNIRLVQLR